MMQTKAPAPTAHAEPAAGAPAQRSVSPMPGMGASSAHVRPQAMTLQRLQQTTSNSARIKQLGGMQGKAQPSRNGDAVQLPATPQGSGLPSHLKDGIESLSGISMDGVKVHYNSAEPAQLRAHAFAQGSDIHLGPGQEAHLPHEAWHVVQQAQGRVKPTFQMKTGVSINDDAGLENEADAMGATALSAGLQAPMAAKHLNIPLRSTGIANHIAGAPIQAKVIVVDNNGAVIEYSKMYRDAPDGAARTAIVTNLMDLLQNSVTGHANIRQAFTDNREALRRQLIKWLEDAPGAESKHNKTFGRKNQYRLDGSYENLARGLLGWVLAKPARTEEMEMANEVYGNMSIALLINSLMKRVESKINSLGHVGQSIRRELSSNGTMTAPPISDMDDKNDPVHLAHYQHHFDEAIQFGDKNEEKKAIVKTNINNDQYAVIQAPLFHSLRDKIIVLHDLMENFCESRSWIAKSAGQGLLQDLLDDPQYARSTVSIDSAGKRTGHTADGDPSDDGRGKMMIRKTGFPISHATRDEQHPTTLLARELGIPVWAGQSMTAMRMFMLAKWAGASPYEMTALAWGIFAFWRKDYDHRSEFAPHTLHEVMDIAQNFGVEYSMTKTKRRGGLRPQQLLIDGKEEKHDTVAGFQYLGVDPARSHLPEGLPAQAPLLDDEKKYATKGDGEQVFLVRYTNDVFQELEKLRNQFPTVTDIEEINEVLRLFDAIELRKSQMRLDRALRIEDVFQFRQDCEDAGRKMHRLWSAYEDFLRGAVAATEEYVAPPIPEGDDDFPPPWDPAPLPGDPAPPANDDDLALQTPTAENDDDWTAPPIPD